MTLDHGRGKAPLITIFGGDVTTSRLRAERAVSKLTPFYPMSARWTAKTPLPGGDFAWDRFDDEVDEARGALAVSRRGPGEASGRRLRLERQGDPRRRQGARRPRSGLRAGIDGRRSALSHGRREWARFPDDILWRRSKLGLTMPPADREALAAFMAASV